MRGERDTERGREREREKREKREKRKRVGELLSVKCVLDYQWLACRNRG